jgi:CRP/FNR family transcriptional regulator
MTAGCLPGSCVTRQAGGNVNDHQVHGELAAAFAALPPRVLRAGAGLDDGPSRAIHSLRRGWACRLYDWPDARRAIVEVYLPGDLIGLAAAFSGGPAELVIAATPVTVETVEAAPVLARPRWALCLAARLGEQRRRGDRLAAAIARLDARRRVALMLLDFCERLGDGTTAVLSYHLPLTQAQIGDHLGLTLVHVNRVLRALRDERIVDLNRHVVVIRDLERLRALVDGQVAHRKPVPRGQDLGHAAAMADLPIGLVAD